MLICGIFGVEPTESQVHTWSGMAPMACPAGLVSTALDGLAGAVEGGRGLASAAIQPRSDQRSLAWAWESLLF